MIVSIVAAEYLWYWSSFLAPVLEILTFSNRIASGKCQYRQGSVNTGVSRGGWCRGGYRNSWIILTTYNELFNSNCQHFKITKFRSFKVSISQICKKTIQLFELYKVSSFQKWSNAYSPKKTTDLGVVRFPKLSFQKWFELFVYFLK